MESTSTPQGEVPTSDAIENTEDVWKDPFGSVEEIAERVFKHLAKRRELCPSQLSADLLIPVARINLALQHLREQKLVEPDPTQAWGEDETLVPWTLPRLRFRWFRKKPQKR